MQAQSAFRHALAIVLLWGWAAVWSPVLAQSPAPGPEHQALKVFVGEWDLDAETKAVPALGLTDSGKVAYHHVNEMTNGGFFLETRRTGMSARGPVSELFVYGYSPVSKTYRQDGYGSRGQVRTFTATVSGLVWSFVGTNTNLDGSGTKERYTVTYAPDLQSATVRSEHSKDGVTWYERLTGTYTKVRGR